LTTKPILQTAAPEAQPTNDAQNDKNLAAIALQRAEKTGPVADSLADVTALVQHADEAIAARATWLLGEWKSKEAIPALAQVLSQHKSADLRLQAAASLDRIRDDDSSNALLDACNDADISVRAFAIQSLARRKAVGTERQAIALLERRASAQTDDGSKDIVAALLAICDLGCADHILPAAAAVRYSTKETSEALVFLFQELSPKMEPPETGFGAGRTDPVQEECGRHVLVILMPYVCPAMHGWVLHLCSQSGNIPIFAGGW
jgi:HEAT repeat protein